MTFAPLTSRAVSTCAKNAIVGASCVDGRRQRRRDVAVVVDADVVEAELLQLVGEQAQQVELLRRAGVRLGVLLGLRVDADVAEEPLGGVLGELGGERRGRVGGHARTTHVCSVSAVTAIGLACLSAFLFGAMSVGLRMGLNRYPDVELATVATVIGAFAVAVVAMAAEAPARGVHAPPAWPFLLAGLMQPGIGQLFVTLSIREAGASRASVVLGSAPLASVTIALILLGEPFKWPLILGAVLIVGGGVELARERARPAHVRRRGYLFAFLATILFSVRDNLDALARGHDRRAAGHCRGRGARGRPAAHPRRARPARARAARAGARCCRSSASASCSGSRTCRSSRRTTAVASPSSRRSSRRSRSGASRSRCS